MSAALVVVVAAVAVDSNLTLVGESTLLQRTSGRRYVSSQQPFDLAISPADELGCLCSPDFDYYSLGCHL